MVLSGVPRKKSPVTPPGIDPGTVRLVAQRLNHYATPQPTYTHRPNTIPSIVNTLLMNFIYGEAVGSAVTESY